MNLKRDGSLNFVQNFWSVPMVFRCFTTNFWIGETVDPAQSKVYLEVISVIDWFSSYRCSKFCTKCIKVAKIHHRFLPVLNDYWHSLSCWVVYLDLGQKSDPGIKCRCNKILQGVSDKCCSSGGGWSQYQTSSQIKVCTFISREAERRGPRNNVQSS